MDRGVALRLVGETIREMGMLSFLFVPLDWSFSDRPIDILVLFALSVVSVAAIACGILLEAKNR
jgi:hypothetical protein